MSVVTYFDKIIPYLRVLIDENKLFEQKLQLHIDINMVHISEEKQLHTFQDRIMLFVYLQVTQVI